MTVALIAIGVILIVLNIKAIKKEDNSFKGTLNSTSENIKDFQIEIGKLRKEFAETLIELQKENEDIKKRLDTLESKKIYMVEQNNVNNKQLNNQKVITKNEVDNKSIKTKEIDKLLKEGNTVEEIAEKLKIGKGEVLLVKELYLN